jgi:DNA-binding NtrC family response regulator
MTRKVLIVDDEQAVLNFLRILLMQTGKYETEVLVDSRKAYDLLGTGNYELVLLDMDMPDVTGLDILNHVREKHIDVEIIVLTGVEDVELAVAAMKAGAYDYLKKPIDDDLLLLTMERAYERRLMRREIAELKMDGKWESLEEPGIFKGIITQSPAMIKLFRFVERIAAAQTSVLIMGESGTGKELIARSIHRASDRKAMPFIVINAGVFVRELFASEFFGHIKGAFSGAYSDKKGFLEEAHGGTLFLDEIGELPMEAQVTLLRVLQDGEYFRVGSTKLMHADIRLIAATNKDLWEEIDKGHFRRDLFYRLNVNTISLPPLRDREGDIPLLSYHFLRMYSKEVGKQIGTVENDVLALLKDYEFPGNVREMQNIIHSAVLMEQTDKLTLLSLPADLLEKTGRSRAPDEAPQSVLTLEAMEKSHIKRVIDMTKGNRSHAAKLLGISRVTLLAKMKKFSL